jgi:hypothetical protein
VAPDDVTTFEEACELVRWCGLAEVGNIVLIVPSSAALVVISCDLEGVDPVAVVGQLADPADWLRRLVPMGWAVTLTRGGDLMGVAL